MAIASGEESALDVGAGEVVALEQQRFAGGLAQCIAEAVAEIERSRMPALAEVAEGMPGCRQLLGRDGLDRNPGRLQQSIQLSAALRSLSITIVSSSPDATDIKRTGPRMLSGTSFGFSELSPKSGQKSRAAPRLT